MRLAVNKSWIAKPVESKIVISLSSLLPNLLPLTISPKEQQISLEAQDLNVLKAHYIKLLTDELPKEEEVKEKNLLQEQWLLTTP